MSAANVGASIIYLPQMMITAEEMATADSSMEPHIVLLVQLIKWKQHREGSTVDTKASGCQIEEPAPPSVSVLDDKTCLASAYPVWV